MQSPHQTEDSGTLISHMQIQILRDTEKPG